MAHLGWWLNPLNEGIYPMKNTDITCSRKQTGLTFSKTLLGSAMVLASSLAWSNGTHHSLTPGHEWDAKVVENAPQPALPTPANWEMQTRLDNNASCSVSELAALPDSQLVDAVRSASSRCLNALFSASGADAQALFDEASMLVVANALAQDASQYRGTPLNGSRSLARYLRAGYYVQFYGNLPDYSAALGQRVSSALTDFLQQASFFELSENNAEMVSELVTLIDSAELNLQYLPQLIALFDSLEANNADSYWAPLAVNNVLTVFFRAHYVEGAQAWFASHTATIDALAAMATRQQLIGTEAEYVVANAAAETARFYQYGDAFVANIDAPLKALLQRYSYQGPGASVWLAAADMIDYFLPQQCQDFGICGFVEDVEAVALPIRHQCPTNFKIRAQSLTAAQRSSVCDDLEALQTRFHRIFNTSGSPVAGDLNDELEVVIFASSDQYQLYGGVLFDISTNNGGIYLEGDPTDASNQARFIAYVAEWKEEFEVWNLMHEAVHYLDGRFNMQGDFQDTMSASTVWWTEGIAEYVSKLDDNADAIAVGQQKTWQLSQLFETTYSSSTERIYDWGYLAARYAMQQQPTVVDELLMYTRQGQYSAYQSYLNSIQYDHDGDFSNWLDCIAEDDGRDCSGNDPVGEVLLSESSMSGSYSVWRYVYVPEGYDQLYVTTAGGSGNADLYVKYQGWPSKIDYDHASVGTDNNEKLSIAAQSGRYLHILINAQQPFDGVTLTVSATPTP